jgi:hypothetical protein
VIAGELIPAIGDQSGLMRPHAMHQIHQVMEGVALQIELAVGPALHQLGNLDHIVRTDMTLIWTGMDGNAIGSSPQAQLGGSHWAGDIKVPAVAKQGHLVDIDR